MNEGMIFLLILGASEYQLDLPGRGVALYLSHLSLLGSNYEYDKIRVVR